MVVGENGGHREPPLPNGVIVPEMGVGENVRGPSTPLRSGRDDGVRGSGRDDEWNSMPEAGFRVTRGPSASLGTTVNLDLAAGREVDLVAVAGEVLIVEEATGVAAVLDRIFGGHDLGAGVERVGAAGMEAAAAGGVAEVGWLAGHGRGGNGIVQAGQG